VDDGEEYFDGGAGDDPADGDEEHRQEDVASRTPHAWFHVGAALAALAAALGAAAAIGLTVQTVSRSEEQPLLTAYVLQTGRVMVSSETRRQVAVRYEISAAADSRRVYRRGVVAVPGQSATAIPLPPTSCPVPVTIRFDADGLERVAGLTLPGVRSRGISCLVSPTKSRGVRRRPPPSRHRRSRRRGR
jgi:hypothetical protein